MEDLHKIWSHRWISSKAKPFNSKIDRLGIIAVENISQGEDVGVLGGIIVPAKEIESYWKLMGCSGVQIDDNFFIVPSTRMELEEKGVFNHSCNPNCGFKSSITITALRDIKEGEELTVDYAFCYTKIKKFKCNCGSENCRKIVKPTDWQDKEIQREYANYFSPYLKYKFMSVR